MGLENFQQYNSCLPLLRLSYLEQSKLAACKQAFICLIDQLLKTRQNCSSKSRKQMVKAPSRNSSNNSMPEEKILTRNNNLLGRRKTTWSRVSWISWRKSAWWDLESWRRSELSAYGRGFEWQSLPFSPQTWCFSRCYVVLHPSHPGVTVA